MTHEFQEDKNRKFPGLLEYLGYLDRVTTPFACPYLRILIEDVKTIKYQDEDSTSTYEKPRKTYEKNSFVCYERFKQNGILECKGVKNLRINEKGNLEGRCDWPLSDKIIIEIKK